MNISKARTLAAVAVLGCVALPAGARSAVTPQPVFACSLGKKSVSVTAVGPHLFYKFGTAAHTEMSLTASARQKNVFYFEDRYAGMEYQLRFSNGPFSYIVYDMEGNAQTGASPVSGLVVMKGTTVIANMSCTHYAEFGLGFDYDSLPQDTGLYSAM